MNHTQTVCSKCNKEIMRCRCPGPHETVYVVCDECKVKPEPLAMPPVRGPIVCAVMLLLALIGCTDQGTEPVAPAAAQEIDTSTQVAVWLRAFTPDGAEVSACDLRLEVDTVDHLLSPATCYEIGGADWAAQGILGTAVYGFRIDAGIEANPLHFAAIDDGGSQVGPPTTWIIEQAELGTIDGAWRFASIVRGLPPFPRKD